MAIAASALFAGCGNNDVPDFTAKTVELHTKAVGQVEVAAATGTATQILFWDQENFDKLLAKDATAAALFSSFLDRDVDYYRYNNGNGFVFRTSHAYPDGNQLVYASGISPAEAFQFGSGGYLEADVPERYQNGRTDFLCCDGITTRSGSFNHPFTSSEEQELKYRHLTAKILLVGYRSEAMEGTVGVRDVQIHLRGNGGTELAVPTQFKLVTNEGHDGYSSTDRFSYQISAKKTLTDGLTLRDVGTINIGEQKLLDSCFVVSGNIAYGRNADTNVFDPFAVSGGGVPYDNGHAINLSDDQNPVLYMDVTATMFVSGNESEQYSYTWENQKVEIDSHAATGSMFCPGYEYRIYIQFDRAGVSLRGEEVPWEDGGLHVLPVTPKN